MLKLPLMRNNLSREDLDRVIDYLGQEDPRLTQGDNVREFEEEWSNWLGVRFSVFVNSGSSANFLTMAVFREIFGVGEVIVPTLTWPSDITSVIFNGCQPKFVDIDRRNLCMDVPSVLESISDNTKAVFMTHCQGFNGLSQLLLETLSAQGIILLEDVCEAHGASFGKNKLGTFGRMSNFSFYYAHHMTTIEGGMISTNDETIYEILRMYRSHGMVREACSKEIRNHYRTQYPQLNPEFIFAYPGYNVRNNEIGAIIGRSQLSRLDVENGKRRDNIKMFLNHLDDGKYQVDFDLDGNSNYAFPLILNEPDRKLRSRLETVLRTNKIEFRRGSAGGGNQLRQPYLKDIVEKEKLSKFPNVEHIHFFGYYIANFPNLTADEIVELCSILKNL
jgi:CDP-6-deoxy-D-xylo-4-hexulose-3-dehydrase